MEKQIALITGASSGIGYATALTLGKMGYDLIVVARRMDRLESLVQALKTDPASSNTRVHAAVLDVRSLKAVKAFYEALPEDWKHIDVLVNNAGLAKGLSKFF